MALANKKFYYRRSGVTYPVNMFTTLAEIGSPTNYLVYRNGAANNYIRLSEISDSKDTFVRVRRGGVTKILKNDTSASIAAGTYTETGFIALLKTFIADEATRGTTAEVKFHVTVGGTPIRYWDSIRNIRINASSGGTVASRTTSSDWVRFSGASAGSYRISNNNSTWTTVSAYSQQWDYCISGLPPDPTGYNVVLTTDITFV